MENQTENITDSAEEDGQRTLKVYEILFHVSGHYCVYVKAESKEQAKSAVGGWSWACGTPFRFLGSSNARSPRLTTNPRACNLATAGANNRAAPFLNF